MPHKRSLEFWSFPTGIEQKMSCISAGMSDGLKNKAVVVRLSNESFAE